MTYLIKISVPNTYNLKEKHTEKYRKASLYVRRNQTNVASKRGAYERWDRSN